MWVIDENYEQIKSNETPAWLQKKTSKSHWRKIVTDEWSPLTKIGFWFAGLSPHRSGQHLYPDSIKSTQSVWIVQKYHNDSNCENDQYTKPCQRLKQQLGLHHSHLKFDQLILQSWYYLSFIEQLLQCCFVYILNIFCIYFFLYSVLVVSWKLLSIQLLIFLLYLTKIAEYSTGDFFCYI